MKHPMKNVFALILAAGFVLSALPSAAAADAAPVGVLQSPTGEAPAGAK